MNPNDPPRIDPLEPSPDASPIRPGPNPGEDHLNARRCPAHLERSLDSAMQWVVFEPNGEALWAKVRTAVEDFLLNEWRSGALQGNKPEEAYFVHCDQTTMTQNDLDNGRLVCVVGVAPVKPAEFVIFRIGQWTADHGCGTQKPG